MSETTHQELTDRLKSANRKLNALSILLDDESIGSMPEWVQLLTTDFCNLSCPHCNTHGTEEKRAIFNHSPNMAMDLFGELAKESLPWADEVTLTITGEPLATPNLPRILETMHPYGAKLNLVTNGTTVNAKRLALLIPVAGFIKISIDGATPAVLETTRRGAKWGDLLTKIKALMLTVEGLPDSMQKPYVMFQCVAMASNLADFPYLVRLAKAAGVRKVGVAKIMVEFKGQEAEAIEKHPAYYNAMRLAAMEEAKACGVELVMPPPFEGVRADATARPQGDLICSLPADYYDTVPEVESGIDLERAKEVAANALALMKAKRSGGAESGGGEAAAVDAFHAAAEEVERRLESVLSAGAERIEELENAPETPLRYCEFSHRRAYVAQGGAVTPCCQAGRPILGNTKKSGGVEAVWHSDAYREFRSAVRSEDPPDCCKPCWFLREIPARQLLEIVDGEAPSRFMPWKNAK